jgi:hypothetical protein
MNELEQLQAAFPDWDIKRIFGGYRAVPNGVPIIEAAYVDAMRDKLADTEWDLPDGLSRVLARGERRSGRPPDAA